MIGHLPANWKHEPAGPSTPMHKHVLTTAPHVRACMSVLYKHLTPCSHLEGASLLGDWVCANHQN